MFSEKTKLYIENFAGMTLDITSRYRFTTYISNNILLTFEYVSTLQKVNETHSYMAES